MKRKTTEEFIEEAIEVQGDKYDYSQVEYKGASIKVTIICPEHGPFEQTPHSHLRGHGCPECAKIERSQSQSMGRDEFIKRANKKHNGFYDYSEVEYINNGTKVRILCPKHGVFEQRPSDHLNGQGCPECANEHRNDKKRIPFDIFLEKAKAKFGDKFTYDESTYCGISQSMRICCPEHGEFWVTPNTFLKSRHGCRKCAGFCDSTQDFINKANKAHDGFYDYSKVDYKGPHVPVLITCPKHGDFWQTPDSHINQKTRCPRCGVEKHQQTCLKKFGVKEYVMTDEFKEKSDKARRKTMLERYGAEMWMVTETFKQRSYETKKAKCNCDTSVNLNQKKNYSND